MEWSHKKQVIKGLNRPAVGLQKAQVRVDEKIGKGV
jgi:hypothetical protein